MNGRWKDDRYIARGHGRGILLPLALSWIILACSRPTQLPATNAEPMPITDQVRADLEVLRSVRVFFGHQSVGGNIIAGLTALAKEVGVDIAIAPEGESPPGPGIIHAAAGRNNHPSSKIASLATALENMADNLPQQAMVKLCYVDFNPDTDSEAVFRDYRDTMISLQRQYPAVTLIHATVPLTTRPVSVKDVVKRLIGRSVWEDDANTRRAAYNQRLRETFKEQPLFDLARIESTRPDGSTETFTNRQSGSIAALYPGYASDDGHLNAQGRRLAAVEFARVIAGAANKRSPQP